MTLRGWITKITVGTAIVISVGTAFAANYTVSDFRDPLTYWDPNGYRVYAVPTGFTGGTDTVELRNSSGNGIFSVIACLYDTSGNGMFWGGTNALKYFGWLLSFSGSDLYVDGVYDNQEFNGHPFVWIGSIGYIAETNSSAYCASNISSYTLTSMDWWFPPVNGVCGPAARTYGYAETGATGTYCSTGTVNPSSPTFPDAGTGSSYSCDGLYGGTSATCYMFRESTPAPSPVKGVCGPAARTYGYAETGATGDYCTAGTLSGSSPSFPSPGTSTTYACNWQNGGDNVSCNITVQAETFSCATPPPNFAHVAIGNATCYAGFWNTNQCTQQNQDWTYQQGWSMWPCTYYCTDGYTGTGCTTAPDTSASGSNLFGWLSNPLNTISNDVTSMVSIAKNVFEIKAQSWNELGFSFTGYTDVLSFQTGAQVACGMEYSTTYNPSCSNVISDTNPAAQTSNFPLGFGTRILRNVTLSGTTTDYWAYDWITTSYSFGLCQQPHYYNRGYIDIGKMTDSNGNFTYLKNIYGQSITTTGLISFLNNFKIEVNIPFDIKIMGYSLLNDSINYLIQWIDNAVVFVIWYGEKVFGNILDILGMFFLQYQPPGNYACFFGGLYYIPSTFTETGITHTQNGGQLDLIVLIFAGIWAVRKFFKFF